MKKRILSMLICLVILSCIGPIQALTEDQNVVTLGGIQLTVTDNEFPNNDELFSGYVDKVFYGGTSTYSRLAREELNTKGQLLYDFLKEDIEHIANGELESTTVTMDEENLAEWNSNNDIKITWTASDLGVDAITEDVLTEDVIDSIVYEFWTQFEYSDVFYALLHDCPYELYWFDKTSGVFYGASLSYTGTEIAIVEAPAVFMVSADYQPDDYDENSPMVDTAKTSATTTAVNNAKAIVSEYASLSDYNKLLAYSDKICSLVSYNNDAIDYDYTYGDPWQLIYVFDNDSSTNVVCEGYSKAFQYLCDLSSFVSDISCYEVTGDLSGGTGGGAHMWNIVTMGDGKSYLIDVTNSDEGTVGENGEFFLAGTSGSIEEGYTFTASGCDISFLYDDETVDLWGADSDSILLLAGEYYTVTQHEHSYTAIVTDPTCTEDGYTTYTCTICGEAYTDNVVSATGHSWSDWITIKEPTGAEAGKQERVCSVCGEKETKTIAMLENSFVDVPKEAYYFEPVLWAVANGITTGIDETHFGPDEPCTRAQVVTFLWRAAGEPEPTAVKHPFVDLEEDAYYCEATLWAVENGITTGIDEMHFGPNEPCTRAQVATFLWRAEGEPDPTTTENPFTDLEKDAYYCEAILWAVENNITDGMGNGKFEPNTICTRGQIVTFLYRTEA